MSLGSGASSAAVATAAASSAAALELEAAPSSIVSFESPRRKGPSKISEKLPIATRTGNPNIDSENDARRSCFQQLIDICLEDDSHVLPLFHELQKRLQQQSKTIKDEGDKFASMTTFKNTEEEFALKMVLKHSDMKLNDLILAKQHDGQAVLQLLTYLVQVGWNLQYPQECQLVEVTIMLFDERIAEVGNRLADWKKKGGVLVTGAINWKLGCFLMDFTDDFLTRITHRPTGDTVAVDVSDGITRKYTLHNNWDDYGAYLHKPPLPPIPVSNYFKASLKGPFKLKRLTGKSKDFQQMVTSVYSKYLRKRDALTKGTRDLAAEAESTKQALGGLLTQQKQSAMTRARETALKKQLEVKKRRTIALDVGD
jgi:hypothetical protein